MQIELRQREEMRGPAADGAALDVNAIENGALLFRSEHESWPSRLEELVPGYLKNLHADPWGRPYALLRGEGGMAIVSAGPDGELGTGDDVLRVVANPILSGLEDR